MTTTEHTGATATANFANSMRDALAGIEPAALAPVETPPSVTPAPVETPKPAEPPKTAPEPVKAPEAKPEGKVEEPDIEKWPRTAQEWKKWNEVRATEYKKRDDEIAKWKGEATTLQERIKATPTQHPEYESVKKERDQLSDVLKKVAVENHPQFKAFYDSKVTAQVELAKRVAGPEKADQIARALSLPDGEFRDRQIEEIISDMPGLKQGQIANVLNSLSNIQAERDSQITEARANYDNIQKQQADQQKQARVNLETQFNDTVKKLQGSNPLYQFKDGDNDWNKGVSERVELAKHFLLGNPKPDQIIEAAANAAAYPALIQSHIETLKENATLKAQIASLSSATPKVEGTKPATTDNGGSPQPVTIPANSRPMEAAAAFFKGLPRLGQ